ncbi:hypothetical protein D9M72_371270 [compost metagenome]
MISYFFTSSQCGNASPCKSGMSPSCRVVTLSSGVFPSGTRSAGRFGNRYSCSVSSSVYTSSLSDSSLLFSFNETVLAFSISALAFSPLFINSPMSLDSLFDSDKTLSISACVALLFSSSCTASSTILLASMFLFAKALRTFSWFSLINAICNIILVFIR